MKGGAPFVMFGDGTEAGFERISLMGIHVGSETKVKHDATYVLFDLYCALFDARVV